MIPNPENAAPVTHNTRNTRARGKTDRQEGNGMHSQHTYSRPASIVRREKARQHSRQKTERRKKERQEHIAGEERRGEARRGE